jgi:hypothetical protein
MCQNAIRRKNAKLGTKIVKHLGNCYILMVTRLGLGYKATRELAILINTTFGSCWKTSMFNLW